MLSAMIRSCLAAADTAVTATAAKRQPELDGFLLGLGAAFAAGLDVDWTALTEGGHAIELPTYAFERENYWLLPPAAPADVTKAGLRAIEHPLLSAALDVAEGGPLVATGRAALADLPWLADHAVAGSVVVPGAAVLDLVLEIGRQAGFDGVAELAFEAPLVLPAEGALALQAVANSADGTVRVFARAEDDAEWTCHASARLDRAGSAAPDTGWAASWPPANAAPIDFDDAYERLADLGYAYGPAFRGVVAAWRLGDDLYVEAELPQEAETPGFGLHPALLDTSFHPYIAESGTAELRVPFVFHDVRLHATGATGIRVRIRAAGEDRISLDVADGAGLPVLAIGEMRVRALTAAALPGGSGPAGYGGVDWIEHSLRQGSKTGRSGCRSARRPRDGALCLGRRPGRRRGRGTAARLRLSWRSRTRRRTRSPAPAPCSAKCSTPCAPGPPNRAAPEPGSSWSRTRTCPRPRPPGDWSAPRRSRTPAASSWSAAASRRRRRPGWPRWWPPARTSA